MDPHPTPGHETGTADTASSSDIKIDNRAANRGAQGIFHGPVTIASLIPRTLIALAAVTLAIVALNAGASLIIGSSPLEHQLRARGLLPERFGAEQPGETLILVVPFFRSPGVVDSDAQHEIARAIREQAAQLHLSRVRVEELRQDGFRPEDQQTARTLGERYRASMIIWGADTSVRVEVSFLHMREPTFAASQVTINETEKALVASGPAYVHLITDALPRQFTFLALFALGQSAFSREEYSAATSIIERALAQLAGIEHPPQGSAEAYFRLGWLYQVPGGDPKRAQAQYDQSLALDPHNPQAYTNRGAAHYSQNNLGGAISDLNRAIEIDPQYARAYTNRGLIRQAQGNLAEATQDLNRAIELDPQAEVAYVNRSIIRYAQGNTAGAIQDLDQAIKLDPEDAQAYSNRGAARTAQGDRQEALQDLNRAIDLNPKLVEAYINRGNTRILEGDRAGALQDFDKAIALDPDSAKAYGSRGAAHYAQGDLAGARRDLDQAIRLDPKLAAAYLLRAIIRQSQGDTSGAIADYLQVRALSKPDDRMYSVATLALTALGQTP